MAGDNYLFFTRQVAPFLVTARLAYQQKLVSLQDSDDLIRSQPWRATFTQS